MASPILHVALMQPEIPPNTGNVGRLCLGIGATLHLVHPLGFSTDEKAVRRAGLDYWRHVEVVEHANTEAFLAWATGRRVHAFTKRARRTYAQIEWEEGDVLLFGRESVGLDREVVERFDGYRIPMTGETRSLNLSNAVAVVSYAALRELRPAVFEPGDAAVD